MTVSSATLVGDKKMVLVETDLPVWYGSHIYTLGPAIPKGDNVLVSETTIGALNGKYNQLFHRICDGNERCAIIVSRL